MAGLVIAAPASGSGKTLVTLALLRAFARKGLSVSSAKVGPDYIDPAFHAAASGNPCRNLDPWAMRPDRLHAILTDLARDRKLVLAEGVMGLFDGARDGTGSTADLAMQLNWPVVMVVDVKGQAVSAVATLQGFAQFRPGLTIAGVIFNRAGGAGHQRMLKQAMDQHLLEIPVIGYLPRHASLQMPERHLGLVQAGENEDLESFLNQAADWVATHLDLERLQTMATGKTDVAQEAAAAAPIAPLGQRIAVARDEAYAFCYESLLEGWHSQGAEISIFSPLADEGPQNGSDAVYLPGGYPELHAGRLAGNRNFLDGLREAAARGSFVFGECGGYMTLGETLTDAAGEVHEMAGLLPLSTSFAKRRLHLGYRHAHLLSDCPLGAAGQAFRGHEFHYATIASEGNADRLFEVSDALGEDKAAIGLRVNFVAGSFLHLIDRA